MLLTKEHKKPLIICLIFVVIISAGIVYYASSEEEPPKNIVQLNIPSITQAPGNNWNDPWGNACEEASASMVEAYYQKTTLTQAKANTRMEEMFAWENKEWNKNTDTDAEETKSLIEANTKIDITIKRNPTLEQIKEELRDARPVIALLNHFTLYNEAPTGIPEASYHVLVITGYNDDTKEFTVNDPARPSTKLYSYDRLMESLHDLDETGEANGTPTVLFTSF